MNEENLRQKLFVKEVKADKSEEVKETQVLSEHFLTIRVNGYELYTLNCTKADLKELCIGILFDEGLISGFGDIAKISLEREESLADIRLNKELIFDEPKEEYSIEEKDILLFDQGFKRLKDVRSLKALVSPGLEKEWVFNLAEKFAEDTRLHSFTSGTHSCMLARSKEVLYNVEDIGRQNAIDKVIGLGVRDGVSFDECILFSSGRVPLQMVRKVIMAGIPVLVSKSVPTRESVELAGRYGLTLICRAFTDSYQVFMESLK
ncbi:MAG: formate dehydrogenase accessory sulfurtransferase FdhD [Lachnospiraceae bacterium]|nr:formate dehydrogenase accessory sulfurtransferase FdhD [Lachnospiraceae bacterium]